MHKGKLGTLMRKAKSEGWADRIRSENDERAVLSGCQFDEDSALHIVAFFEEFLRHGKGEWAGKPFTLLDWQRYDVIEPLFGWLRSDGTRRFRRAYLEVPKKNGKSTLAAGVSLYLLVGDGEMGAEVYSAAADRDQASIVFREAASMVGAAPELTRACVVRRSTKTIAFEQTGSFYRALSADVPTKEGLNIHGLIFDELHAQRSRDLWDALVYGGGSRKQPLFLSITTAGYDRHSICWEQHEYAQRVIEGTLPDEAFFGYIRAADGDAEPHDRPFLYTL